MDDHFEGRIVAHRDYLDDMLRRLGYALADLEGAAAREARSAGCCRSRVTGRGASSAFWREFRQADDTDAPLTRPDAAPGRSPH